jgi:hypothetical protein
LIIRNGNEHGSPLKKGFVSSAVNPSVGNNILTMTIPLSNWLIVYVAAPHAVAEFIGSVIQETMVV